jgi:hypothetical protein
MVPSQTLLFFSSSALRRIRTRTHGHGHGNGHGEVARDRKGRIHASRGVPLIRVSI